MSVLTLGSITYSKSTDEPINYVAGIPNSESGPLYPRLFRKTDELTSLFGDFKYRCLYERLISHDIPSVLIPTLTKVSKYNRSSIRLNNDDAYIKYTHPRPEKNYNYRRQGEVVVHRVDIPKLTTSVITNSKIPAPYVLTDEYGKVMTHDKVTARYVQTDSGHYRIDFEFNEPWIGTITISSYPSLESTSFVNILNFGGNLTTTLNGSVFPEQVTIDPSGYEIYDISMSMTPSGNQSELRLVSASERSGTTYLRLLTEDMINSQYLVSEVTKVSHGLGYYPNVIAYNYLGDSVNTVVRPIINISKNAFEITSEGSFTSSIEYLSDPNRIVTEYEITSPANTAIVQTESKYHVPYLALLSNGDGTYSDKVASVKYSFNEQGYSKLEFEFNEEVTGKIYVVRYPLLEGSTTQFAIDLGTKRTFNIDNYILPEVVVIDANGYEVTSEVTLEPNTSGSYTCTINLTEPRGATAWIRVLSEDMITTKLLTSSSQEVSTDLDYTPSSRLVVNNNGVLSEYVANIIYTSDDSNQFIVSIGTYESTTGIQYSIRTENESERITIEKIESDALTYSMVLDFSNVLDEPTTKNQYLILSINGVKILYLKQNNSTESIIASDYYDELVNLTSESLDGLISEIKSDIASRLTSNNILDFKDECINSIKNAWEIASNEYPGGEPSSSALVDTYQDWSDLFYDKIYETELFLNSYKVLVDWLKSNLSMRTELDQILTAIAENSEFNNRKLLINYTTPSYNLNFYGFEGLKLYTCFDSEQDILSEFTEDSKIIEFYSKIKGPQGDNIKINITEISEYCYEIRVELDNLIEYHYVYTKKVTNYVDAIDIHQLSNNSDLVEVKLYDYELPTGKLIDQFDFLDYYEMDEFDPNRVRYLRLPTGEFKLERNFEEYIDYSDWKETLNEFSDSGYYPDLFLAPEVFLGHELEQYSDIHSYVRGDELNSYGGVCDYGVYSQALCSVNWQYLQNPSQDKFPDERNRLLYFYGDLSLDDEDYPAFYPYIEAIIRGTGLTLPDELILSDIDSFQVGNVLMYHNQPYKILDFTESDGSKLLVTDALDDTKILESRYCKTITSILTKVKINYLEYNGLYYYYTTLREKLGQPSLFLIQYTCSKISREFKKAEGALVSNIYPTVQNPVINLISRILNITPYLESLDHRLEYSEHTLKINLTARVKGLINKQFLVNYILNLS